MSASPRTLIRATPSLTASRGAPSVPACAETYEPLVKAALRTRLQRDVLLPTALFSWASASMWRGWNSSGGIFRALTVPFMPVTLVLALLTWFAAALPIIILRKQHLQASRVVNASPKSTFDAVIKRPGTIKASLVYTASAAASLLLHYVVAYATETHDPKIGVFGRSKKHPFHINGRFLYLIVSQLVLVGLHLFRSFQRDRLSLKWLPSPSSPTHETVLKHLPASLVPSTIISISSLVLSFTTFGILRSVLLRVILRIPLLSQLVRPFIGSFLRSRAGYTFNLPWKNFDLLVRVFFLSLSTLSTWEFTELMFESCIPTPIKVASSTPSPSLTLISGTTSSDEYLHALAFTELAALASSSSDDDRARAERVALFTDQKYSPSLWSTLVRRGLLLLGEDYQVLVRRGQPVVKAAPQAPAPAPRGPLPPSTPVIKGVAIFKNSPATPLQAVADGFASNGLFGAAAQEAERKVESAVNASALPELFRSVGHKAVEASGLAGTIGDGKDKVVAKADAAKAGASKVLDGAKKAPGEAKGLVQGLVQRARTQSLERVQAWVKQAVPQLEVGVKAAEEWWVRERVEKKAEMCLRRRELDVSIIEALSYLVVGSLEEDRYGVVAKDIPRILEAFLSFLAAVDAYHAELVDASASATPEQLRELGKAGMVCGQMSDAMKEAVARIVSRFGNKLVAFKFAPATAQRLQAFVDVSAR